jgi:hypothetical protein
MSSTNTDTDTITIEWAPFRVRPDVTEAELRAASAALQDEFLVRQPGYLRRELLRGEDGGYVDLVWWQSRAAADAIMEAIAGSAACARFFALLDGDLSDPAAGIKHFTRIATYSS